jgi:hypothetical protein
MHRTFTPLQHLNHTLGRCLGCDWSVCTHPTLDSPLCLARLEVGGPSLDWTGRSPGRQNRIFKNVLVWVWSRFQFVLYRRTSCSVVAHRCSSVRTPFESTTAKYYYYCRNIFLRPLEQTNDSSSVQLTGRTLDYYCIVSTTCLRVQYCNTTCVLPRTL